MISRGDRHAYLIIAHRDDLCFRTLLTLLDDVRNDIFIHMDSKNKTYDQVSVNHGLSHSGVYHLKRRSVIWGSRSQIDVEIELLEAATKRGRYSYYHLLSGQDLPLKSQDFIHSFFENHAGKEFVRFQDPVFRFDDRVRQYHLFQDHLGRRWFESRWNRKLLNGQKRMGIWRHRNLSFQKGTNWFSITDALARYIVSKKRWLKRTYRFTLCCDEVFVQSLILNTPFMGNLYHPQMDNDVHAIMRLIDWKRGDPYVFKRDDYEELASSDLLFARKFDSKVDSAIIEQVRDSVLVMGQR